MEPERLPDITFEAPVLDVPDPPPGTPYAEFEDHRSAGLLRANGIEPTGESLLAALRDQTGILRAAAAHTVGATRLAEALPLLESLLTAGDDDTAVAAAYALTRFDSPGRQQSGRAALTRLLQTGGPMDLSRLRAAGHLAQARDPIGYQAVAEGLRSPYLAVRMTACRQLYAFAATDTRADVAGLFRTALADDDTNVQWQALAQLRALGSPALRPILKEYAEKATDEQLRAIARDILDGYGSARLGE